ncbi:MAG: cation transporter, partial [Ferruginibacter sp.]
MKIFNKLCLIFIIHSISLNSFAQTDSTSTFEVSGVCAMCKQRIEKSAKIKGVRNAMWDIPTQKLTVTYNADVVSVNKIQAKIAASGHDTPLEKASDDIYSALPDCCLYRDISHDEHNEAKDIHNINGVILSEDHKGNLTPLQGATIIWRDSQKGTTSDVNGVFTIVPEDPDDKLVISYAGYSPDTLEIKNMNDVQVILGSNNVLKAVQVSAKTKNTYINRFSAIRIQTVTSGELLKAACCNLSESFETNPSVDVAVNDAATGSRQIQLLGLSGNYTQLTVDNLPGPRGLATAQGLNSIAGPWVEGIQIIKGAGSVVNGYESIAG